MKTRLTQFSSAAGCGCKIDAMRLQKILEKSQVSSLSKDPNLLIGNENNEDAAAYFLDEQNLLLSSIDFFTPVVDDPYEFGYIAAANALSDIYAMGGRPVFALSVLGWPLKDLPEEVAAEVVSGAQEACSLAQIKIAGGHSIENKEPVFGLNVNGLVHRDHIKLNGGAKAGDLIVLTKPLGVGILTTAIKRELIEKKDYELLLGNLKKLNDIGEALGKIKAVHAMTDVTGFGLAGHLLEVCKASGLSARLKPDAIPHLTDLTAYIEKGSLPGGLHKNWKNYSPYVDPKLDPIKELLADPQTNGPLLFCIDPPALDEVKQLMDQKDHFYAVIGEMTGLGEKYIL